MTREKGTPIAKQRDRRSWIDLFMTLAIQSGVILGVPFGAFSGALLDIQDEPHAAAIGVLVAIGTGVVAGGVIALLSMGEYRYAAREVPYSDSTTFVRDLNIAALRRGFLLARKIDGYLLFESSLEPSISAGPVSLPVAYTSVAVQLDEGRALIAGPHDIVLKLAHSLTTD